MQNFNLIGLSDRGYSCTQLIRPDDDSYAAQLKLPVEEFSFQQAKHRSPVETLFSAVKNYEYASERVKDTPEIQAFNLMTIYNLVQIKKYK